MGMGKRMFTLLRKLKIIGDDNKMHSEYTASFASTLAPSFEDIVKSPQWWDDSQGVDAEHG